MAFGTEWDVKDYPAARRTDVMREFFGEKVADPYAWMEEIDSPETRAWLERQSELTGNFLSGLSEREAFLRRLRETNDYDRHGLPTEDGGRLFYSKRLGLERQGRYFWREDREGSEERELFNPNGWSEDGTVSLAGVSVNDQGALAAYGVSSAGSDWSEWKIRDVNTGEDLPETLKGIKFSSASWKRNGEGFYYGRFELPSDGKALSAVNENQKVYYHRTGTDQSEDVLVFEDPANPKRNHYLFESLDSEALFLFGHEGAAGQNACWWKPAGAAADEKFRPLTPAFQARFSYVSKIGGEVFFVTDYKAPRGRMVAIPLENPDEANWRVILPERDDLLEDVTLVGGRLIAEWLRDASSTVTFHDLAGAQTDELKLPGIGTASGFSGRPEDSKTYYSVSGYTDPGRIYELNLKDLQSTEIWRPTLPFDSDRFETARLFATSKDGTKVPIFLIKAKGAAPDRPRPIILTGYGGFNISLTPGFSPGMVPWLERDAMYAIVNLRGGGEFGEDWHRAGQRENKQNVFDDFIAAAEYLTAEGWTDRRHLAIKGGSNGGLLIGAVLNQRPDLFAAAAPQVGVMDMLRFDQFTIGWAWRPEYGDPAESQEIFHVLKAYSPLHNIRGEGGYPAVMVMTGDHDDRVFPAHSFKYAAELQRAQGQSGGAPALLRVDLRAGHGAGKPLDKALEETADLYAFFWEAIARAASAGAK